MRFSATLSIASFAGVVMAISPLIPTDVSTSCNSFLADLDTNSDLATCANALVTTTKAFAPGSTPGSADLTSTLQTLCHSGNPCSDSMLRGLLMKFNSLCRDELVNSGHDDLKNIYGILYLLSPFQSTICSTDPSTKQYCVQNIKSSLAHGNGPLSNTTSNFVNQFNPLSLFLYLSIPLGPSGLNRRGASALTLNTTTWQDTNMVFLGMNPTAPASQLCTPCSKSILQAYSQFENLIPYACGLANSPLLGVQIEIWNTMTSKCGSQFMNSIMTNVPGGSLAMHGGTVSVKTGMTGLSVVGTLALGLFLTA